MISILYKNLLTYYMNKLHQGKLCVNFRKFFKTCQSIFIISLNLSPFGKGQGPSFMETNMNSCHQKMR